VGRTMKQKDEPEIPTQETLAKGEFREEPLSIAVGSKKRLRRLDGSEIDRLYYLDKLSQDEHNTLELFQADLYKAGLVFCPRAGMVAGSTSGHSQFIADTSFRRVKRVSAQMELLAERFSYEDRGVILSALTMDRKVSIKKEDLIRRAAQELSKFYSTGR